MGFHQYTYYFSLNIKYICLSCSIHFDCELFVGSVGYLGVAYLRHFPVFARLYTFFKIVSVTWVSVFARLYTFFKIVSVTWVSGLTLLILDDRYFSK